MSDKAILQANNVQGPYAGKCVNISMAGVGSPVSLDLSTIGWTTAPDGVAALPASQKGGLEHFVFVQAVGADLLIVVGASQAAISGANAPVAATTGTSPGAGMGRVIPAGTTYEFRPNTLSQWLGAVSTGAGTMRVGPA